MKPPKSPKGGLDQFTNTFLTTLSESLKYHFLTPFPFGEGLGMGLPFLTFYLNQSTVNNFDYYIFVEQSGNIA